MTPDVIEQAESGKTGTYDVTLDFKKGTSPRRRDSPTRRLQAPIGRRFQRALPTGFDSTDAATFGEVERRVGDKPGAPESRGAPLQAVPSTRGAVMSISDVEISP